MFLFFHRCAQKKCKFFLIKMLFEKSLIFCYDTAVNGFNLLLQEIFAELFDSIFPSLY